MYHFKNGRLPYNNYFFCKNGTRFRNCLINLADGDVNVIMMFMDNLPKEKKPYIRKLIEKGKFARVIKEAFVWDETPETTFWEEIYEGMKCVPEKGRKEIETIKSKNRVCCVCGIKISGQGRHKYCADCQSRLKLMSYKMTYAEARDKLRAAI